MPLSENTAPEPWTVYDFVGVAMYTALALIALWGAFCIVIVWMRVAQKRFRNEQLQTDFLIHIDQQLAQGNFQAAMDLCEGDQRAMPQLTHMALEHRGDGYSHVRQMVLDRFHRDVLADLEHWLSWVNTVVKSAPMVGLLGTVTGMMGAFAKLATAEDVKPAELAENISLALITTACGLSIAIPLIIAMAAVNIRIRKMEDLVAAGLTHFLESFRGALSKYRS